MSSTTTTWTTDSNTKSGTVQIYTSDVSVLRITAGEGNDAILDLFADQGDDNADKWRLWVNASDDDLHFSNYTSGTAWTDILTLQDGGNVGIGTDSPNELLHLKSSSSGKPSLLIENTNADANAATIDFSKNTSDTSPADDDVLGIIQFKGDDSGGTLNTFARIYGSCQDVTNNDESGGLMFETMLDGSGQNMFEINSFGQGVVGDGTIVFNEQGNDMDFRVEAVSAANALFVQGSDGNVGIGTNAPLQELDLVGQFISADNKTDDTNKQAIFLSHQYDSGTETEGFMMMETYAASSVNRIDIGGGHSSYNAATEITFNTAANNTTRTGTERMSIQSDGKVGIGATTVDELLHIESTADASIKIESTGSGNDAKLIFLTTSGGGATNDIIFGDDASATTGRISYLHNSGGESDEMTFTTAGSERMRIADDGKVGIGTGSPDANLEIEKDAADLELRLSCHSDTEAHTSSLTFIKSDNTAASPATIDIGAVLGQIIFNGYDDNGYDTGSKIVASADASWSGSERGTKLAFYTRDANESIAENLTIAADGNVGIGAPTPDFLLEVSGSTDILSLIGSGTGGPQLRMTDSSSSSSGDVFAIQDFLGKDSDATSQVLNRISHVIDTNTGGAEESSIRLQVFSGISGTHALDTDALVIRGQAGTGAYVGIGTSSPDQELHIVGSNTTTTALWTGAAPGNIPGILVQNSDTTDGNYAGYFFENDTEVVGGIIMEMETHSSDDSSMSFATSVSGATRTKMVLDKDGNLGIGDTGSINSHLQISNATGGNMRLHREDTAITGGESLGEIHFAARDAESAGGSVVGASIKGIADGTWDTADDHDAGTNIEFFTQDVSDDDTLGTARMVIQADGNIGIGTTAPQKHLHVDGTDATDPGQIAITTQDGNVQDGDSLGYLWFGATNDASITGTAYGAAIKGEAAGTWGNSGDDADEAPAELQFFTQDGSTSSTMGTPRMVIDRDGNVGIGEIAPSEILHLKDSSNTSLILDSAASGSARVMLDAQDSGNEGGEIYFQSGGSTKAGIWHHRDGIIKFATGGSIGGANASHMQLAANGMLGIGPTAPTRLLHISDVSLADGEFAEAFVAGTGNSTTRYGSMGVAYNSSADTNAPCAFMRWDTVDNVTSYFWVDDEDDLRASPTADHIGKSGSGTAIPDTSSDERLKNISSDPFPYGLEEINRLNPIKFSFKSSKANKQRLGFGAQTTKPIIPEVVNDTGNCIDGYSWELDENGEQTKQVANSSDEDTRLSMSYNGIIPVLVKAIQELTAKVEALENENKKRSL